MTSLRNKGSISIDVSLESIKTQANYLQAAAFDTKNAQ